MKLFDFIFGKKEKPIREKTEPKEEDGGFYGYHFRSDDKLIKAMDRAAEKHDKRAIEGWLKSWIREDRKDQRHWEKELMKTYGD